MHVALLVARVLLVLVFSVAGVTKLADRTGSKQALVDFGLPASLAAPLGVLLPLAELAVAAALIPTSTAWWGAVGALLLLLLFVVGISANLARGRKPECHCFGQLHSEPAGWKTLVRNGVLAAVAGFVVWQGYGGAGPSAVGWLAYLSTAQLLGLGVGVAVLGLVAAQWWFLLGLLRQNGRLAMRVEALEGRLPKESPAGLPLGEAAPDFELPNLHGQKLTLEALRAAGKPVILLFTDPNCGPCTAMFSDVGRWQDEYAQKLTVALVSRGEPEEHAISASEHGLRNVLLQKDWEVSDAFGVDSTPSAVLVRPDGTIGGSALEGVDDVRNFLATTVEEPAQLR
jgi:methylamine dehydrogenase accessory protein MauD